MALEVMLSEKGKPLILFENYKFYKYRVLKTTEETSWCCIKKSCRAKVYTLGNESDLVLSKQIGAHEHETVTEKVLNRQKLNNQVKRKVEEFISERPSKLIHREVSLQQQMLETLTSKDIIYIRNNIGKQKRKQFSKLPKSSTEVQECLNSMDVKTVKNEKLLLSNDVNEEIVIFSCTSTLEFMCQEKVFYMDGTFQYCPKYFMQLFTIHVYSNDMYVPVVFCLLKNKQKSTYKKLFQTLISKCNELGLSLHLEAIVVDFEEAIHSSIAEIFSDATIVGCRFHLAQSWYRKIQQVRLTREYQDTTSLVGKWLHYSFGLTYLSPEEVGDAFSFELAEEMPADSRVTEFADYLVENYTGCGRTD